MTSLDALMPIAVGITTVGGAWLTIRKISKDLEKSKEADTAKILQSAKEEIALSATKMDNKIHELKTELKNLESNVEKDLDHIRETQRSEMKVLGEKIESLREELRAQNRELLMLISKLIDHS